MEGAQLQCSRKLPCGPQGLPRHASWAVTSFPTGSGLRLSHHGRSGTATCGATPSRQKALSSSPVLSSSLRAVTHSPELADVPNVASSLTTAPAATVSHHGILHVRPRLPSESRRAHAKCRIWSFQRWDGGAPPPSETFGGGWSFRAALRKAGTTTAKAVDVSFKGISCH